MSGRSEVDGWMAEEELLAHTVRLLLKRAQGLHAAVLVLKLLVVAFCFLQGVITLLLSHRQLGAQVFELRHLLRRLLWSRTRGRKLLVAVLDLLSALGAHLLQLRPQVAQLRLLRHRPAG